MFQRRFGDVEHAIRKGRYEAISGALDALGQDIRKSGKALGYDGKEEQTMVNLWRWCLICGCGRQMQHETLTRVKLRGKHADAIEKEAAAERAKSFRKLATKASENEGGAAHAYTPTQEFKLEKL